MPKLYSFIVIRKEHFGGYLFNPYRTDPLPVNEVGLRIIELSDGTRTVNEIVDDLSREFSVSSDVIRITALDAFTAFSKHFAINWAKEKISKPKTIDATTIVEGQKNYLSAPLSILWDITYACNLKCKQCLVSAGKPLEDELVLDEIKDILDQLSELKAFNICFLGGEPLMRQDFVQILEYASKFRFGISFSTNGLLINNHILKELEKLKVFQVQVSLDGLEKTHNHIRGLPNAFQLAIRAIKQLIESGIQVGISTTVNKLNLHELDDLLQLSLSLGAIYFKPIPIMPVGRGKDASQLTLYPEDTKDYVHNIMIRKKEYQDQISIFAEETYSWLFGDPPDSSGFASSLKHTTCAAGTSQLVISPNGLVFPCPFLHDFLAGDLRKETVAQIWENSSILKNFREITKDDLKGKCNKCPYAPLLCRGGCRAAAYALTNDFYAEDPMCWYKPPS